MLDPQLFEPFAQFRFGHARRSSWSTSGSRQAIRRTQRRFNRIAS